MQTLSLMRRLSILVVLVLGLGTVAEASHFRFAHNTWRRVSDNPDGSVTVEFTSLQAWRADGLDMLGLDFGDGNFYFPAAQDITDVFTGTDLAGEGYTIRRYVVQHSYDAAAIASNGGQFLVVGESCCRIGSLINAGDASERIETRVDLNGGNQGSPVSNIPVILQLSFGQTNTLALGIADPQGDPFSCRMASSSESQIPALATAGGNDIEVSPNCVLSWNLTGTTLTDVGNKYAVQIIIEETNRCVGQSCGSIALDFIIELVQGNPPSCSSDKPVNNTVYANFPFSATFTGTDTDPGAVLTLTSFGAPAASTFTPASGASQAAPFAAQFQWTPTDADRGTAQAVLVTYQDETGLQGVCTMSLQVSLTDPEITCGTVNVMGTQFAMDGNAFAQRGSARNAARKFRANGGSKKAYKNYLKDADKFYVEAWTNAWVIPNDLLACGTTDLCTEVSTSALTAPYLDAVAQLDTLTKSIISKIKAQGQSRQARSLSKSSKAVYTASVQAAAALPPTQSSCPGVNVLTAPQA